MSDIVNIIRGGFCEPNTGCMSIKKCICDVLDEAADEIEMLREQIERLREGVRRLRVEAGYD